MINFSNHPASSWSASQKEASLALEPGQSLVDVPFPPVDPALGEAEVEAMAERHAADIAHMGHRVVLCQGEFTLSFGVARRLLERGLVVVAATAAREAVAETQPDGAVLRRVRFRFVRYRRYVGA